MRCSRENAGMWSRVTMYTMKLTAANASLALKSHQSPLSAATLILQNLHDGRTFHVSMVHVITQPSRGKGHCLCTLLVQLRKQPHWYSTVANKYDTSLYDRGRPFQNREEVLKHCRNNLQVPSHAIVSQHIACLLDPPSTPHTISSQSNLRHFLGISKVVLMKVEKVLEMLDNRSVFVNFGP